MTLIMYSTGCPRCQILHEKLDKTGYAVTVIEGAEEIERLGFTAAPVLSVDGKFYEYGDAVRWVNNEIKRLEEEMDELPFMDECESCGVIAE